MKTIVLGRRRDPRVGYWTHLKNIRLSKRQTSNEIAKDLSISRGWYSGIESGRNTPSKSLSQRMEKYFGLPIHVLTAKTSRILLPKCDCGKIMVLREDGSCECKYCESTTSDRLLYKSVV